MQPFTFLWRVLLAASCGFEGPSGAHSFQLEMPLIFLRMSACWQWILLVWGRERLAFSFAWVTVWLDVECLHVSYRKVPIAVPLLAGFHGGWGEVNHQSTLRICSVWWVNCFFLLLSSWVRISVTVGLLGLILLRVSPVSWMCGFHLYYLHPSALLLLGCLLCVGLTLWFPWIPEAGLSLSFLWDWIFWTYSSCKVPAAVETVMELSVGYTLHDTNGRTCFFFFFFTTVSL